MTISVREIQMLQEVLVSLTGISTMSIQELIILSKGQFHDPNIRQTLENEITRLRASAEAMKGLAVFFEGKLHGEPKKSAIKRHLEKAETLTGMIRAIQGANKMEGEVPELSRSRTGRCATGLRRARTSAGKSYRQESVTECQDVCAAMERNIHQLLGIRDGDCNITSFSDVPAGAAPSITHDRNRSHATTSYHTSALFHSRGYSTVGGKNHSTVDDSNLGRLFSPEEDRGRPHFHLTRALGTSAELAKPSNVHQLNGHHFPTNSGRLMSTNKCNTNYGGK